MLVFRLADESVTLNKSYFHPKCSPSRWIIMIIIGMTILIMITKATLTLKNCRAALLTGYHPHVLGLQRAGVGR